jgi:unsaturated chondroitin disaccharide hydrolase
MRRLPSLAFVSIAMLASEAGAAPLGLPGIGTDLSFVEAQASKTLASLGSPTGSNYPLYGGETGTWKTVGASSWTSGFFPGELWLLYQATGSQQWLTKAQAWTAPLASQATRTDTADVGFIIGTSFGNGYRLTGTSSYKTELLTAGASLATYRYNSTVGAVRSWSFGPWSYPVIIDTMMNLGPLQWGAHNGGNPAWAGYAVKHAQTTANDLVRSNGSTFQLANFDPTTGALLSQGTYAGYSNSSTWARGEAWALYGFTQAYETSGNKAFLTTAEKVANWFVGHLPSDYVPYWDFNAPVTSTTPRDTSAAAIAADGLVMLSTVAGALRPTYLSDAENILGSLSTSAYLGPATGEAVLAHGTDTDGNTVIPLAPAEVNTALIFGDYYFTEALLRLQDVLDNQPGWSLYSPQVSFGGTESVLANFSLSIVSGGPAIPESSTWTMLLLGFAGFAGYRRAKATHAALAA